MCGFFILFLVTNIEKMLVICFIIIEADEETAFSKLWKHLREGGIGKFSFTFLGFMIVMLAAVAFATWRAWLPFSAYPVFYRINSRKRLKSRAVMRTLRNTILAYTTGSAITDVFGKYNATVISSRSRIDVQ